MKSGQLAEWLQVNPATIRKWAREYAAWLSESTVVDDERAQRNYTDLDARIIAHIAGLKSMGVKANDIPGILQALKDANWADLPSMPMAPPGVGPVPMIPEMAADTALQQQRAALTREIALLSDRIADLSAQLTDEKADHKATRAELLAATARVGELQGRLDTLDGAHGRERRLLIAVVAVVFVAAAILLAVVVLLALNGAPVGG